jgi:anti-sigma factor ChrR (cupin superfamily)
MTDHEQYEVLCALAATGQLHTPDKASFDEHFLDCRDCRDQLHDLSSIDVRLRFEAAGFHAGRLR